MKNNYKIGNFIFSIELPENTEIPENFKKFICYEAQRCDYEYIIKLTDTFQPTYKKAAAVREDLLVYSRDNLEERFIGIKGISSPEIYASYRENSDKTAVIEFSKNHTELLNIDTVFTSLLALERRMIERGAIILHSSYTLYKDKGILFSAPSGTGKSTQSSLWQKYKGTPIVNGDRSLLDFKSETWYAEGWPVCGSSGICQNEEHPIGAIVMLSQAPENEITSVSGLTAVKSVFSQTTVNMWNSDFVNNALSAVEKLCSCVPVYHLRCNISEDAVRCLDSALKF